MFPPMDWRDYKSYLSIIDAIIEFWLARIVNPPLYEEILKTSLNLPNAEGEPNRHFRIQRQEFWEQDCSFYVFRTHSVITGPIVDKTLVALAEAGIIHESSFRVHNKPSYYLNVEYAKNLNDHGLLKNQLFGFPFIVENYRRSVFKVVTETNGTPAIGSAFLLKVEINGSATALLATNRHVAENKEILKVFDVDDVEYGWDYIELAESDDVAVLRLTGIPSAPSFALWDEFCVLDEIITMGYPPVAQAISSYQLVHRGEINASVKTYTDKNDYIIFSAKTAPGNSGGPIINRHGGVVGIITRDFFEQEKFKEWGHLPYFSAVPIKNFHKFLNERVLPALGKLSASMSLSKI